MLEAAKPTEINQSGAGTCGATSATYMMSRTNPAEYVRLTTGLCSPSGSVQMANGETLNRGVDCIRPDLANGRSATERVLQNSLSDYANGATPYNTHTNLGGGIGGDEARKMLSAMFNHKHIRQASEEGVTPQGITDICDKRQPKESFVALSWGGGNHFVAVDKVDKDYVYFRNPHGSGSAPGGVRTDPPPREVLDPHTGYTRMKKSDFYTNVQSVSIPD